nr:hypothetical protein [Tanacetum cinerariifolium]
MGSIDSLKYVLTQSALDDLCEKYYIPDAVHPELPGPNSRIRRSPVVIAAAKVSHFEILCRVHGFVPTVGYFFSVPWHIAKSLRKNPPPAPDEFSAKVCDFIADNPAPFKKFLEAFLCLVGISRYYTLDENSYPTFWDDEDEGAGLDLFPSIHHADPTKEMLLLRMLVVCGDDANWRGGLMLQPRNILSRVVMSSILERIEILADGEAQALVADKPKKLKKRKTTDGAGGSGFPPKKLREDHGTSGDASAITAGKSLAVLQDLFDKGTLAAEAGATTAATYPLSLLPLPPYRSMRAVNDEVSSVVKSTVPSFTIPIHAILTTTVATTVVTATSISRPRDVNEATHASNFADSTSAGNVDPAAAGPSQPSRNDISSESFYVFLDMDSEALHQAYVPRWDVLNDSLLDDSNVCRSVVDQLATPVFFSQPRAMKYDQLLSEFNVGDARLTCLSAEVRMHLEHLLGGKKRLESKCGTHEKLLKERDLEIADLKAHLSLKETEEAAQACELGNLKGQSVALKSTADLSIKASTLECEKDKLIAQVSSLEVTCYELRGEVSGYQLFKERIEEMQDAQVKVLSDRVASMDSDLMALALHMDEEFYPRFQITLAGCRWILSRDARLLCVKCMHSPKYMTALGGAIGRMIEKGMQDKLAAGIDHGQAGRVLADVAAHDPSKEANYLGAINDLRSVDFPLIAQLEFRKDTSIIDIMDLLYLEGSNAKTVEDLLLQPSPEQLMV